MRLGIGAEVRESKLLVKSQGLEMKLNTFYSP